MKTHRTTLSLPFQGTWFVAWGGDTKRLNAHHDAPPQRFALDILIVDERGRSFSGAGKRCEAYYAFGKPIVAPADGLVIEAIDGVRDNIPRLMSPSSAMGNAVTITHRRGEVSILAHLQCGSVMVKAGDRVQRGQRLGACGNSGNSSEPHLHYHLQDLPIEHGARGIRCCFQRVVVIESKKAIVRSRHAPLKGQLIRPG